MLFAKKVVLIPILVLALSVVTCNLGPCSYSFSTSSSSPTPARPAEGQEAVPTQGEPTELSTPRPTVALPTRLSTPKPTPTLKEEPTEVVPTETPPEAPTSIEVIETTPPDGAADVDAATTEIIVVFSAAVKQNSWSFVATDKGTFPDVKGDPTFQDNQTCTLTVALKPGVTYSVGVNSATKKGFKSAADEKVTVTPYVLTFTTAGR
jgi:hypothetical protein